MLRMLLEGTYRCCEVALHHHQVVHPGVGSEGDTGGPGAMGWTTHMSIVVVHHIALQPTMAGEDHDGSAMAEVVGCCVLSGVWGQPWQERSRMACNQGTHGAPGACATLRLEYNEESIPSVKTSHTGVDRDVAHGIEGWQPVEVVGTHDALPRPRLMLWGLLQEPARHEMMLGGPDVTLMAGTPHCKQATTWRKR
ncbi:hypothetical protein HaLaN_29713 [Haematococcus lacustris]|uniref:Uncharacterized protein n=1 Tax=Haematococcus lacustris TaxID=44745 RepID=A0A6A0AEP1_HAELA|nr:hypothetical protein HaLaN_29713 [Haematococcus lacustris]